MLPAVYGMTWTWPSVDLERMLQETASDQGLPCLLLIWDVKCLHIVIFYSVFGTVQILIVLQGVRGMTWVFCLDGRVLAGSVDLDRTLRNKASDLGPPCSLLVWDVTYMLVVIYFVL